MVAIVVSESKLWQIEVVIFFPVGTIFCTIFHAFYEQCLNCVFSVHAICTAHDYFIIVTYTLRLHRKNILSCALVIKDLLLLPPLSQSRFLFTNKLSTFGIVVLCSDQKFINHVSHEKVDIKIEISFFFRN